MQNRKVSKITPLASLILLLLLAFAPVPAAAQGSGWAKLSLPAAQFYALASDPNDRQCLLAGSWENGVYRSMDGGGAWQALNDGLANRQVRALVIDAEGTAYAGTYGGGVYRLSEGGATWTALNGGLGSPYIYSLAVDVVGNVYAGTIEKGVYRLAWGSPSWVAQGLDGITVWALAIAPSQPQTIYAGTWEKGVYRSDDGGASWARADGGLGNLNVRALAVHPTAPESVYAGTWGGGVYRTADGGAAWIEANQGLTTTYTYALNIVPGAEEIVHVGTNGLGLSRLIHGEDEWAAYGLAGSKVYALHSLPLDGGYVLYAGVQDGVWMRRVEPAIALVKSYEPASPITVGEVLTYTLRYTNTGEIKLTNLLIRDFIPAKTAYEPGSSDGSGGTFDPSSNLVEWRRESLHAGGAGVVSFAVRMLEPTATPTPTDTATITPTPTGTTTWTPTPSPTVTMTITLTATYTPTATATPTSTAPITLTATWTPSPSPTATTTPPTVTPTPSPTATGTVCVDALANGNFETGQLDGWTTLGRTEIITDTRHFGAYAVRLGGYNRAQDELCQLVTIPAGAVSARVSYWWHIRTQQIAHPRDYLYLELRDSAGQFLANLDAIDDGDTAHKWLSSPPLDLLAYAGQTVGLCFVAQTDAKEPTSFALDDVSLHVCLENGATPPESPAPRAGAPVEEISVFNVAAIYTDQTGWVRSNAVINSPRSTFLPLILKP
ncbi:MAG: DUF11 domain-containing protein [Chloroflexi bacterium]|nr:DUF11 domain-containing protein [Chloroflexota bacterium]